MQNRVPSGPLHWIARLASRVPVDLTPKLATAVGEGYRTVDLKADALAGLTVAIVALPLSMAIAIASGLPPERGLYAAIFGGFLVSLLGGSRYQVGGPAGAFIVLVAGIAERHGVDGLMQATMMAGCALIAVGGLRLGGYIRFIPYPVVVGFSAGIAAIIFASQIKELLGLDTRSDPAALLPKLAAILEAIGTVKVSAVAISALSIGIILVLRRYRPAWPGMLIAVVATSAVTALLGLDITTIGSRFGGIPGSLPQPSLPSMSLAKAYELLPDAAALALLGAIESLLSAVVADSLSGRRHRSNIELVAQGVANVVTPVMGGFTVTGTIARTATNLRSGARTPVAGMLHSVYLLIFMLIAAPLARHIPLAALGGILAIVAWNMADLDKARELLAASRGDAATVAVTFLLTIFADLTIAIMAGIAMGSLIVLARLAEAVDIENSTPGTVPVLLGSAGPEGAGPAQIVYRLSGALFFGTSDRLALALDEISGAPRRVILDLTEVTIVDSSASAVIETFAERCAKGGGQVIIVGASAPIRRRLLRAGLKRPLVRYARAADALPPRPGEAPYRVET